MLAMTAGQSFPPTIGSPISSRPFSTGTSSSPHLELTYQQDALGYLQATSPQPGPAFGHAGIPMGGGIGPAGLAVSTPPSLSSVLLHFIG